MVIFLSHSIHRMHKFVGTMIERAIDTNNVYSISVIDSALTQQSAAAGPQGPYRMTNVNSTSIVYPIKLWNDFSDSARISV